MKLYAIFLVLLIVAVAFTEAGRFGKRGRKRLPRAATARPGHDSSSSEKDSHVASAEIRARFDQSSSEEKKP
ncbi:unnamed protein product, partial [Mesorhabditis spiculigera]